MLSSAVAVAVAVAEGHTDSTLAPPEFTLISWALAQGLVVLTRDGALPSADDHLDVARQGLAHRLAATFATLVVNR